MSNPRGQGPSGWPMTPGVGVSLLSAFMWAAEVSVEGGRAQLIDQFGVSTLIHEGWLEDPSRQQFYVASLSQLQPVGHLMGNQNPDKPRAD